MQGLYLFLFCFRNHFLDFQQQRFERQRQLMIFNADRKQVGCVKTIKIQSFSIKLSKTKKKKKKFAGEEYYIETAEGIGAIRLVSVNSYSVVLLFNILNPFINHHAGACFDRTSGHYIYIYIFIVDRVFVFTSYTAHKSNLRVKFFKIHKIH